MQSTKKKILIALYYYHPYISGISIFAKKLAEGLAKKGYSMSVLTTRYSKNLPCEETINNVRIIRCSVLLTIGKGVISPSFLWNMVRFSWKNDIVNFHLPLAEAGIVSLFIPKKKIISSYQCDLNLGKGSLLKLIEKISFFLMRIALRRSRKITALSIPYFLKSRMKKYSAKALELRPLIETDNFQRFDDNGKFRDKLGISADDFVVGFVGRIVYEKGLGYLLDSLQYLISAIPKIRMVVVGDYKKIAGGSIKKQLDIYLKKYPGKILFTGFISGEDLISFYSTINTLVLPSIDPLEAFGIVQIEAMCCGCPVIASDRPGVDTVVKETGFGYLVRPKDTRDIAEKIQLIYNKKYSGTGFHRQDWDIRHSIDKFIKIINNSTSI